MKEMAMIIEQLESMKQDIVKLQDLQAEIRAMHKTLVATNIELEDWKKIKSFLKEYLSHAAQSDRSRDKPLMGTKIAKRGDLVHIAPNATYYTGKEIPPWIKAMNWYVEEVDGDRAVINISECGTNEIRSSVNIKDLIIIYRADVDKCPSSVEPYQVHIPALSLNIYQGPGSNYACVEQLVGPGVYTIVAESDGQGASKWGMLRSGIGWISLDNLHKS